MNEIGELLENTKEQQINNNTEQQVNNKTGQQIDNNTEQQVYNNTGQQIENNTTQQLESKTKRKASNKVVKIIVSIVPLFCAFIIQIIVSVVFGIVYSIIQYSKLSVNSEIDPDTIAEKLMSSMMSPDILLLISMLAASICIPIFAFWYWSQTKNEYTKNTKIKNIKKIFSIKNIFFIVILGLALQVGINTILSFIEWLQPKWFVKYNDLMKFLGDGTSLLAILYAGFIAPVSEELICRGVILSYSKKALPFMYANILQALLFGIYHGNIVQGTYAFVFGLFLGFLCMKFKSIIAPIILHMAINLSGIILSLVLTDEIFSTTAMIIILFVISLIVAIISTIYFKNIKSINYDEEERGNENLVEI